MQIKKAILAVLVLVCGLAFVAYDKAPENAAQLYEDIYEATELEKLGDIATKQQIIKRFEEAGLSAVDSDNRINMVNWESIDEFCIQLAGEQDAGENNEDGAQDNAVQHADTDRTAATVYVINDDGGYTQYELETADGTLHVKMEVWTGGEEPRIDYQNECDAVHCSYTEKGYLFFGAEHPTGDFGPWLETAIRVKPLDAELRQATEDYLMVLGYEDNNLFIENWNEQELGAVDLYDLYEVMTGNITAENESIPEEDFEAVMQQYLDISREQIHGRTEYDAESNTYIFSSRTAEAKGSTPDMPHPEVIKITDNSDGTITLLVEAVWPKYRDDRAFVHEVTVKTDDGGFKYISNRVLEKKMETSWYVSR